MLPPDLASLPLLQSRVSKFGKALESLRHEFFELTKLISAAQFGEPSAESNSRRKTHIPDLDLSLGSTFQAGGRNAHSQSVSDPLQHHGRVSSLHNVDVLDNRDILPSTESEDTSADDDSGRSHKRPREFPPDDGPARMMKTFCVGTNSLVEVEANKKKPYSKEKLQEVQDMRARGACDDCRLNKRRVC
jgi:hypothetical protein